MVRQFVLLLVVLAVTGLCAKIGYTERSRKICVQIVTVILTLFSGLRSWWFGDLIKYYTLYCNCNGENWRSYVFGSLNNSGIRILFRLCGVLHISYDVCIFLVAAFVAVTLGLLVFRYSPSPYWSYLIYIGMGFYIFTYTGLKQTIAMGFCCLAMDALLRGKPGKFALWVLAGALFHAPGLIFLLAYPFSRKKIDPYYFFFILLCLGAVFLFRDQIVSFLSEAYYEDEDIYEAKGLVGGRFLMMLAILVLSLFLRPLHNDDTRYTYLFNTMVIAALLQTFSVYNNNFTRLADYYYQFSMLFIPMMLESGWSQAKADPKRRNILCYDSTTYHLLWLGITVFALWFYSRQIAPGNVVDGFRFFWEVDPYALYGT